MVNSARIVLSALQRLGSARSGANDDLHFSSLLRCTSSVNTLSRFHELDHLITMPSESKYPSLQIPNVDLWAFLFERKDKPFADDKGKQLWDQIWFHLQGSHTVN